MITLFNTMIDAMRESAKKAKQAYDEYKATCHVQDVLIAYHLILAQVSSVDPWLIAKEACGISAPGKRAGELTTEAEIQANREYERFRNRFRALKAKLDKLPDKLQVLLIPAPDNYQLPIDATSYQWDLLRDKSLIVDHEATAKQLLDATVKRDGKLPSQKTVKQDGKLPSQKTEAAVAPVAAEAPEAPVIEQVKYDALNADFDTMQAELIALRAEYELVCAARDKAIETAAAEKQRADNALSAQLKAERECSELRRKLDCAAAGIVAPTSITTTPEPVKVPKPKLPAKVQVTRGKIESTTC